MLPSVLHPVCMSKNYQRREQNKKKQAERETVTQQSRAKHKWNACVFKTVSGAPRDTPSVKHGVISSHSVFTCVYFANSFIKVNMKVARRSEACWLNKAEHIHISLPGTVKVSLQPGPCQGCIWFSRFRLQRRLTSTALHKDKDRNGRHK